MSSIQISAWEPAGTSGGQASNSASAACLSDWFQLTLTPWLSGGVRRESAGITYRVHAGLSENGYSRLMKTVAAPIPGPGRDQNRSFRVPLPLAQKETALS